MPNDKAAIDILPPSNTFIACLKPSPGSPTRFSSGILQLSKIISAVSLALIPSLFSFLPPVNPGVLRSTINAVELSFLRGSPVLQITTATSLLMPCVIQFLVPLTTQSLPSLTAVHFILPASLPVLGSVNPQAPICSAVANFGRYLFFCFSFPNSTICPEHSELCAATDNPIDPQILAIS